MKKYMKNKDFVPEKFYDKIKLNRSRKENQILTIFIIINLILIPFTAKRLEEVNEKPIVNNVEMYGSKPNNINLNDINIWIENIIKDGIEEAYITNNNGEIIVNDLAEIDKITSNRLIKIRDVNRNSSGKYKLGVSLNE